MSEKLGDFKKYSEYLKQHMFIISSANTMTNLNTNLKEKKALLFLNNNQIQLLTDSKIILKQPKCTQTYQSEQLWRMGLLNPMLSSHLYFGWLAQLHAVKALQKIATLLFKLAIMAV